MRLRTGVALTGLLLGLTCASVSKAQTGTPPFGGFSGGPFDTIDNANLNVHFAVPIFTRAGRGTSFSYTLGYDTTVWAPVTSGNTKSWLPAGNWGWSVVTQPQFGHVVAGSELAEQATCPINPPYNLNTITVYWTVWQNLSYVDPSGTSHPFPGNVEASNWQQPSGTTVNPCGGGVGTASGTTTDGSGYTVTAGNYPGANGPVTTVTAVSGIVINPPSGSQASYVDTNGNEITANIGSTTTFLDNLNASAALTVTGSGAQNSPYNFGYTNPVGTTSSYKMNFTNYSVQTNFGCSGISEYSTASQALVSSISLPDGSSYTFDYESTPGHSGSFTGRLQSVTLPTGGTYSYTYSGGNNGIDCSDGTAAAVTRATPDGSWTYARAFSSPAYTTITDPQNNQTQIYFQGIYETERKVYQGSTSGTLLATIDTCYNNSASPCTGTAVSLPISQVGATTTLPGSSGLKSKATTLYSTYGLPTETDSYDYGSGSVGPLLSRTTVTYNTSLGNGIVDRPSNVQLYNGVGTMLHQTLYSYDGSGVTATSGTPQHVIISGSRGNATTIQTLVSGTNTYLTQHYSYFDTGKVDVATDVNNATTTYTYGACGNSFPTSTAAPLSLTTSQAWNCNGAVVISATDANNRTTTTAYNDPNFWRPTSTTDPTSATTNMSYGTLPSTVESALKFNGSTSTADIRASADGLGRAHVSQTRQAQGSANFDSVETDYDPLGRISRVTMPYTGVAGQTNSSAPATTTSYDALSRPLTVTDGGGGATSYAYTQNDVLITVAPAPTGENTKKRQLEYDGLGRLTSVCEITSATGSGACGQSVPQGGYWTKYTYDGAGNLLTVIQNAQSTAQTRTFTYDDLARMLSETNPENGTTSYTYDSDAACGSSSGDRVKRVDAIGNVTCYGYDGLHRSTSITYPSGTYASVTASKTYVYDAATVNGAGMANTKGRLAEAYTGPAASKASDLGYGYTARGQTSDVYEATAHSGGYYHLNATYWQNGALNVLTPGSGMPNWTYGADGEGRSTTVLASSGQNPVTAASYNAFGPTGVTFGSNDSDSFAYDPNTGRQTNYTFHVGGYSVVANLTWNLNGTLRQLAISDPTNTSDTQTCTDNYDDLLRLIENNCGSIWGQSFSYDPFGNIAKTVLAGSAGTSFQPTYYPTTNRYQTLPGGTPSYDANGNVLFDGFLNYHWDAEGKLVQLSAPETVSFDALGRLIEDSWQGSYTQTVFSPTGERLMYANGQTISNAYPRLPGGAIVQYNGSTLAAYLHPDWLGSPRFYSGPTQGAIYGDMAYAPFGEEYIQPGYVTFWTGVASNDLASDLRTFPAREYENNSGRWTSPDPGGVAAANPANPQSWNRYAYVGNNPLSATDPTGMFLADPGCILDASCDGGGGGYDPCWGSYDEFGFCAPIIPPPVYGGNPGAGQPPSGPGNPNPPSAPGTPTSGTGFPPGSFPGGENLGLPPGLQLPNLGGLLSSLFPFGCEFGPCLPDPLDSATEQNGSDSYDRPVLYQAIPYGMSQAAWMQLLQGLRQLAVAADACGNWQTAGGKLAGAGLLIGRIPYPPTKAVGGILVTTGGTLAAAGTVHLGCNVIRP